MFKEMLLEVKSRKSLWAIQKCILDDCHCNHKSGVAIEEDGNDGRYSTFAAAVAAINRTGVNSGYQAYVVKRDGTEVPIGTAN
jgi:hypothetical protein